jgi:DNA-binding CsgD family transcriptional regulator
MTGLVTISLRDRFEVRGAAGERLHVRSERSPNAREALAEALDHVEAALLLVGPGGAIIFANKPAKAMLGEGRVICERDDALRAVTAQTDRMLRDTLASAERGDASAGISGVAVPLSDAAPEQWFAHVLPLTSGKTRQTGVAHAPVAAVFIRRTAPDALPSLESVARLYKLTAGEVRVLDALLKVDGVKAIAAMLGLSQATVRTHLHNVFQKTGTRRQSKLVKLIAGI